MHPLAETLLDEPVIAAVKTDEALAAALASPCSTIFLLASTLLNVAYFAPVTFKAFFGKRPEGEPETGMREAPMAMVIPILVAAAISVILGIYPDIIMVFVKAVTG